MNKKLKSYRESNNYSYGDMAERLNISEAEYIAIENEEQPIKDDLLAKRIKNLLDEKKPLKSALSNSLHSLFDSQKRVLDQVNPIIGGLDSISKNLVLLIRFQN